MKKMLGLVLAMVMCLTLCVPALAAEPESERVTIEVDTLQDVREFYKSPEYDSSKLYSFIIKYHPTSRAPCPRCGKAAWIGKNYGVDELTPYSQTCPNGATTGGDNLVVMFYHYQERCNSCGYEISHDQYYFVITCNGELPDVDPYEAWDGQRFIDGYDAHEDKSTWWVVEEVYHRKPEYE